MFVNAAFLGQFVSRVASRRVDLIAFSEGFEESLNTFFELVKLSRRGITKRTYEICLVASLPPCPYSLGRWHGVIFFFADWEFVSSWSKVRSHEVVGVHRLDTLSLHRFEQGDRSHVDFTLETSPIKSEECVEIGSCSPLALGFPLLQALCTRAIAFWKISRTVGLLVLENVRY